MRPKYHKVFLVCLGVLVLLSAMISESDDSSDKIYQYSNYTSSGSTSSGTYSSTPKHALTKEEADALRGSGYNGTRPNSVAEGMELAAAQVKCHVCGMHSTNGYNSACNACRAKGYRD